MKRIVNEIIHWYPIFIIIALDRRYSMFRYACGAKEHVVDILIEF